MKEKNKTKKRTHFYTYNKLVAEMQLIDAEVSKREFIILMSTIILSAFLLCFLFKLKLIHYIVVLIAGIYVAPFFYINDKRRKYEQKKFNDINSYMTQMGQSFSATRVISTALNETKNTFTNGKMKKTIDEAEQILSDTGDTKKALSHIEEDYGCERLAGAHEFILKADKIGGDCNDEIKLLEGARVAWWRAISNFKRTQTANILLTYIEFILLDVICAFICSHSLPENLSVMRLSFVQWTNAILIVVTLLIFKMLDRKRTTSYLEPSKVMSEVEAEKAFSYVDNFKKNKHKLRTYNYPIAVFVSVCFLAIYMIFRTSSVLIIAVIVIAMILNLHNISKLVYEEQIKKELSQTFPNWIFEVILLLQKDNVPNSIVSTYENMHPVFKHELKDLIEKLEKNSHDINIYVEFLGKYNISGIEDSMRALYSINEGTGNAETIKILAENNMKMLSAAEEDKMSNKGAFSNAYFYLPIFPCVIVILIYGGGLIVTIFDMILELLG